MAINTNQRNDYVGNGVTSTFPYTFKIFAETDLQVTIRDTTGNETALSWPVQFSVLGVGNPAGGSITLTAGSLTSNWSLAIKRIRPFSQGTSLSNQSAYQADTHENTFDHLTMLAQQLKELTDRAIKVQTSLALGPMNLVLPTPVPNNVLGWDAGGTSITNVPVGNNVPSSMDAANVTFTQQGAGASPLALRDRLRNMTISVKDFGAVGDGSTDDWQAITNGLTELAALGGGTLLFELGKSYKSTKTIQINSSNVHMDLNRSEVVFSPTGPYVAQVNDRILNVGTPSSSITGPLNTNGAAINVGDRSFVTAVALTASAGDWIIVYEIEPNTPGGADVCRIDFVQISSVVGTTVNLYTPFRVAFPGTHSTPAFLKIANAAMVQNVTVRNGRMRSTNNAEIMAGVTSAHGRNILFQDVVSAPINGQPFYTYRSCGVKVHNCTATFSAAASEFAESADIAILGNLFAHFGQTPPGPALRINMGTAFFSVIGNILQNAGDVGLYILDGPQNGIVANNVFSFVTKNSIANGIFARGIQNVIIANNYLAGDNSGGVGITLVSQSGMVTNIPSTGNIIENNAITGFANQYGTKLATDAYIALPSAGMIGYANGINLGSDVSGPDALLNMKATTAVLAEHLEIAGNSVYYRGYDNNAGTRRLWFAFNSTVNRDIWFDHTGILVVNNGLSAGGLQVGTGNAPVRQIYSGNVTKAPADWSANPVPANTTATATLVVTNAGVNDIVCVSPNSDPTVNFVWCGRVKDNSGTVELRLGNVTTGAQTPPTTSWRVCIFRFQ